MTKKIELLSQSDLSDLISFVRGYVENHPTPDPYGNQAWISYGNFKLKLDEWCFHHGSVEGMYEVGIETYCDLAGL
jgi:hypothetical protein